MKLAYSLFVVLVLLIGMHQMAFAFADDKNINFFLDKAWYEPRDTIKIDGWINDVNSTEIQIEITNPDGLVVVHQRIPLEEVFEIDHQIAAFGESWADAGFYQIKVSHAGEHESKLFAFGNFDPRTFEPEINLDKNTYSWTDTVKISITSPNDNKNIHQIDKITVDISTRAGALDAYVLEETGVSDGTFSGIVTLTGFSGFDLNQDGRPGDVRGYTGGPGPEEGNLAASPSDTVRITYSTPFYGEKIEARAPVEFQQGTIQWVDFPIYADSKALVRVIDNDMRLLPETPDSIKVLVKSYPQKYSKEYTLKETERNSGIFEGKVELNSKDKMSGVFVQPDSVVSVKYVDTTLPSSFLVKKLDVIANATIVGTPEKELQAESIPPWVKKTAGWWSTGAIGDDGFLQAIKHLVDKKIIKFSDNSKTELDRNPTIPHWLKKTAGWWTQGIVSDEEFVEGISHLLQQQIIVIENSR